MRQVRQQVCTKRTHNPSHLNVLCKNNNKGKKSTHAPHKKLRNKGVTMRAKLAWIVNTRYRKWWAAGHGAASVLPVLRNIKLLERSGGKVKMQGVTSLLKHHAAQSLLRKEDDQGRHSWPVLSGRRQDHWSGNNDRANRRGYGEVDRPRSPHLNVSSANQRFEERESVGYTGSCNLRFWITRFNMVPGRGGP